MRLLEAIVPRCRHESFEAVRIAWELQRLEHDDGQARKSFGDDFFSQIRNLHDRPVFAMNTFCDLWAATYNVDTIVYVILAAKAAGNPSFARFIMDECDNIDADKERYESLKNKHLQDLQAIPSKTNLQRLPRTGVPDIAGSYYVAREKTDISMMSTLIECLSQKIEMLLTGETGVGKTNALSRLLIDEPKRDKLIGELGKDIYVLWINCFELTYDKKFDRTSEQELNQLIVDEAMMVEPEGGDLFKNIPSVVKYFRDRGHDVLFVFDDVFCVDLGYYVRKCLTGQKVSRCFVTRDPGLLGDLLIPNEMSVNIEYFEKAELLEIFKKLKVEELGEDRLLKLCSFCWGLPLLAKPIAHQFPQKRKDLWDDAYKKLLETLKSPSEMSPRLEDTSKSNVANNVLQLMRISLKNLDINEYDALFTMLFAEPGEDISVKELELLFVSSGSAELAFATLNDAGLIRKTGPASYSMHKFMHDAAFDICQESLNVTDISNLRLRIVVGKLRSFETIDSQSIRILCQAIKDGERNILEKAIRVCPAEALAELCRQVGDDTCGRNFIHHLYSWQEWPGNRRIMTENNKSIEFVNHSYRLVGQILERLKREKVPNYDDIWTHQLNDCWDGDSLASDIDRDDSSVKYSQDIINIIANNAEYVRTLKTVVSPRKLICKTIALALERLTLTINPNQFIKSIRDGDFDISLCDATLAYESAKAAAIVPNKDVFLSLCTKFVGKWKDEKSLTGREKTLLHFVAMGGTEGMVEELCCKWPDLGEKQDEKGETPFFVASTVGRLQMVLLLHNKYPKAAEIADENRVTPLLASSAYGHLEIVKLLLEKYPETAKIADKNEKTPLFISSAYGHLEIVKLLLEKYPEAAKIADNNERTPLLASSAYGHLEIVELLLEKYPETAKIADKNGITPLWTSSANGHLEIVELLLEKYPKAAEITDENGVTPLLASSAAGHLEIVELLLTNYPKAAEITHKNGITPLWTSSAAGHLEIVELLLTNYPKAAEITHKNGITPLWTSSANGHLEIVELLLTNYPKAAEKADNNEVTPLLASSAYGHLEIVKLLLTNYPKAAEKADKNGVTPLLASSAYGHLEIVELLLEYYPEAAKIADKNGITPLWTSSANGHLEIVELLLKKYPEAAEIADNNGVTPLEMSRRRGHHEISELLNSLN